jgi:hypothetical protein
LSHATTMSSPSYPTLSTADPWDKIFVNSSTGSLTTVRFMPTGRAGLDHRNPGDWSSYGNLDQRIAEQLGRSMTPQTYMSLYYNEDLLKEFLHYGLHLPYDKFKYIQLASDNSFKDLAERDECRLLHLAAQTCIRKFMTRISENIVAGDYGRLDNLDGPRFMSQSRNVEGIGEVLYGFRPYFHLRIESETTGVESIYMVYNQNRTLELIKCSGAQHDTILLYIASVTPLKTLKKVCACCGKTRGAGKNDKLLKCKCKACRYCSKLCQQKHWPVHRSMCGGAALP